ncbi:MAG: hypothetical protein HY883_06830, partial [Deltaproteobacteria bacterium]|nr:hypothetical protein [Deltaproteobacteria bacterium]
MIKRILIILPLFLLLQSISYAQSLSFFTKKYVRTSDKPNVYTDTLPACNTGATYSLVVINGQNGEDVISSASITLNGVEIVREKEFNQR